MRLPNKAETWSGWFRPTRRHRWKLICTDADEHACWTKLHELERDGDYLLRLAQQGDPNQDARVR